jgi:methyl coenzyme M reductase subunit D
LGTRWRGKACCETHTRKSRNAQQILGGKMEAKWKLGRLRIRIEDDNKNILKKWDVKMWTEFC